MAIAGRRLSGYKYMRTPLPPSIVTYTERAVHLDRFSSQQAHPPYLTLYRSRPAETIKLLITSHFIAWARTRTMSSLAARPTLLAYLLLATLLHPCLCHAATPAAARSGAGGANWRMDPKAIDQGVAYVLMLLALFVTYIVH
ncbi:hypothetical protein SETIT_5G210000v2 [Setaria italica]|uniref:Arabinogalactan peptide 22 n=1 Tax=Setaria italica TaxID=4555 RepID=A0A368R8V5_SETIT|nr:hypothetical protein SETIT_5G210000v2 [Setaria italica]